MVCVCPHCRCTFDATAAAAAEHGGACPACWDLTQILAFVNSAGDTINKSEAIHAIRGICLTRLGSEPKRPKAA